MTGLLLRAWVINSNLGPLDSDEAAGGLLALHFLEGEGSVFMWGNHYGGTLEAVLAAPLFALFGSGPVVWKSVMVALYAVSCVLTWRIGLRSVGPAAARLAPGLLWLSSGALVLISTKARLYYGMTLVLICAALLLCLRLSERPSRTDMAMLGLVAGLGLWTAPFCLYVFVPLAVWFSATRPARLRELHYALPGAVLGALPWLAFNMRNRWLSLEDKKIPVDSTYWERFRDFFTEMLPRLFGLRSYAGDWVLGGIGRVVWVALFALALGAAVRAFARSSRIAPFFFILAVYPFIYSYPKASFYVAEPRYGLFLAPLAALLLACGLCRWEVLRRPPAQVAVLGLVALGSVASLNHLMEWARDHPGYHDLSPPSVAELAETLEREGVTTVAADYWIAYALSFESEEKVVASPTGTVRYRPYQERVEAAGPTAYVFFRGSAEARELERKIAAQGIRTRTIEVDSFTTYVLERPLY